jgi:hypothetical protein
MSNWPGTRVPKSTGNAFAGVIPHYLPLSAVQQYRSVLYSRWAHLYGSSLRGPTWEEFRERNAESTRVTVDFKHYPGMQGPLSNRAKPQMQRKVSITIASAAASSVESVKRRKLAKAAI